MDNEELEKLYKEALNADVPDYWDKIEAGIKATGESKIISLDAAREKKAKTGRNMKPYIGLIAAAILMVVIAVPVFIAGFGDRRKNDSKESKDMPAESFSGDAVSALGKAETAAAETTAAPTEAAMAEMAAEAAEGEMNDEAPYYEDAAAEADAEEAESTEVRETDSSDDAKYSNSAGLNYTGKTVIMWADVVQKGDKYLLTNVKSEKDKLEYEEYEVENPDELMKYMKDFDGEVKVWVCAVKDNKVYVYGPAED